MTVSECCPIKLLPYTLFENNYINILVLEMASLIVSAHFRFPIQPVFQHPEPATD